MKVKKDQVLLRLFFLPLQRNFPAPGLFHNETVLMKYAPVSFQFLVCTFFLTCTASAQSISLSKGQKLVVHSNTSLTLVQELMNQQMSMSTDTRDTRELTVDSVQNPLYKLSVRTTKLKATSSAMGQDFQYDSEDTSTAHSRFGEVLSQQLKKLTLLTVDASGRVTITSTGNTEEEDNMIRAVGSDPEQEYRLLFLPANGRTLKTGEKWKDSTTREGVSTITNYEVKSVNKDTVMLEMIAETTIHKTVAPQGVEVTINMTLHSMINAGYAPATGLLQQYVMNTNGDGTADAMGQQIPMKLTMGRTTTVAQ